MKKLTIALTLFIFVFLAGYGSARAEGLKSSTNSGKKNDVRLSTFSAEMKDATSNLKKALNSAREDFKEDKERALEEFKTRLAKIKDERKKAIAAKLNTSFNNINSRRTAEFTRQLDRLSNILNRIESRKNKLKDTGSNVASAEASISLAREAIAAAQTAVTAQSAKDYTISFTSESNLGSGAKTMAKNLRQDLAIIFTKVKAARTAVHDAFKALVLVKNISKEASESGEDR